eukprot:PLAT4689.1.p2 GENE.PLAT4689.1~~PLAT4689.1.p2  ORF type:complete len:186 (+),score=83.51 PLAT4689.1:362-919(+)
MLNALRISNSELQTPYGFIIRRPSGASFWLCTDTLDEKRQWMDALLASPAGVRFVKRAPPPPAVVPAAAAEEAAASSEDAGGEEEKEGGAAAALTCGSCGGALRETSRFCPTCGAPTAALVAEPPSPLPEDSSASADDAAAAAAGGGGGGGSGGSGAEEGATPEAADGDGKSGWASAGDPVPVAA